MGDKRIDFAEISTRGGYESDLDSVHRFSRPDGIDVGAPSLGRRQMGTRGAFVPPPPSSYMHMNAYERHKHFINTYVLHYVRDTALTEVEQPKYKTDYDIMREEHRFLWRPEDEEELTWEKSLARRYYDKLFKEYAIADLSRYKENKIALRWRTQQEVFDGKGQFMCGARKCAETKGLQSWEVNFAYAEHGEKKNALVKVRLCPEHSAKLNYHSQKRKAKEARAEARSERERSSHKRQRVEDDDTDRCGRRQREDSRGARDSTISRPRGDGESDGVRADTRDQGREGKEGDNDGGRKEEEKEEDNIWKRKVVEKDAYQIREEEFDQYFNDLFL